MPEFLVETYVPRTGAATVAESAARAQAAAIDLAQEGGAVWFLRTLFVPEDETCFFLFEADDVDLVRAAATLAELQFERIAEAVEPSEARSARA